VLTPWPIKAHKLCRFMTKSAQFAAGGGTLARQIEFPLAVAVCAWCEPFERGAGLGAVSHGICPRHLRKIEHQVKGVVLGRRPRSRRRSHEGETLLPF
jgi:hypothetical protein